MSPTAPVIDIHDLTKTFGRGRSATRALDGLELRLAPGEVGGFLGPNGAGKTTTLRILLGMIRADAGRVRLFGSDPWARAAVLHERLAYVPGDVALWPGLTGAQTLEALASLRPGGDPAQAARRREELVERFDLDPSKRVRAYSKGNRQKVALIAALSEPVELLVLDEPTSGLDPLMEEVFSQCVAEAADRGTAVLLSSHILSEVERLCATVTIIRSGRTVEQGSLTRIRSLLRTRVHAVVEGNPAGLYGQEGVHELECHPVGEELASQEGRGREGHPGAAGATGRSASSRPGARSPEGAGPGARSPEGAGLGAGDLEGGGLEGGGPEGGGLEGGGLEGGGLEGRASQTGDPEARSTEARGTGARSPGAGERSWEISLSVDPAHSPQVMTAVASLGVRSLTASPPSLEELFLRHYDPVDAGGAEDPGSRAAGSAGLVADSQAGTGMAS